MQTARLKRRQHKLLYNSKMFAHLFVRWLGSAAGFRRWCSLTDTQQRLGDQIKLSVSYWSLKPKSRTKSSLQRQCLHSSHFFSSEPSLHCGVESHSSPGSKQQLLSQVNSSVVQGALHFSPAAHKQNPSIPQNRKSCVKTALWQKPRHFLTANTTRINTWAACNATRLTCCLQVSGNYPEQSSFTIAAQMPRTFKVTPAELSNSRITFASPREGDDKRRIHKSSPTLICWNWQSPATFTRFFWKTDKNSYIL